MNNEDAKNDIVLKFRRNESDDGYGYGNNFTAECFGREDGEIDNDKYYGHEVLKCVHCHEDITDDILSERMSNNFEISICNLCLIPSNLPCGTCFQRTCNGGRRCEQRSP